jgi:hypothetical protein
MSPAMTHLSGVWSDVTDIEVASWPLVVAAREATA